MIRLHSRKLMVGLVLSMAAFAGCGVAKLPDVVESTSLSIDKTGAITSYMVDVFDRDYYALDELESACREDVAVYNAKHQSGENAPLVLEQVSEVSENEGLVMVSYSYDNAETYQTYNKRTFFYGTVEQAIEAGYDFEALNQVLLSPKGSKSIVSSGLKDIAQKHVILLAEATRVYCPYKVAYISENAEALEDGSIDTAGIFPEEYPVIIVLDQ